MIKLRPQGLINLKQFHVKSHSWFKFKHRASHINHFISFKFYSIGLKMVTFYSIQLYKKIVHIFNLMSSLNKPSSLLFPLSKGLKGHSTLFVFLLTTITSHNTQLDFCVFTILQYEVLIRHWCEWFWTDGK